MMSARMKKMKTVSHHFAGPAQYHHGGVNDSVAVPGLKGILNINDVRMWGAGVIVVPLAVSGRTVTYHVHSMTNTHAHDINYKDAAPGDAVNVVTDELGQASGGDITVVGGGANGGASTAVTPATAALASGLVLADDTNISAIDIYILAVGY